MQNPSRIAIFEDNEFDLIDRYECLKKYVNDNQLELNIYFFSTLRMRNTDVQNLKEKIENKLGAHNFHYYTYNIEADFDAYFSDGLNSKFPDVFEKLINLKVSIEKIYLLSGDFNTKLFATKKNIRILTKSDVEEIVKNLKK